MFTELYSAFGYFRKLTTLRSQETSSAASEFTEYSYVKRNIGQDSG